MARRTDGGVRFRPVGRSRSRTAPVYSPRGTGCPAIEQAVQGLYKGQNEESFWTLMSALNYALELETHVLVPLQTALSAQGAPAPWMEHPIPAEKADGLALWTLRNDKGRCWLPLFTSVAAAAGHPGHRRRGAGPVEQFCLAGRCAAQWSAARRPHPGGPRRRGGRSRERSCPRRTLGGSGRVLPESRRAGKFCRALAAGRVPVSGARRAKKRCAGTQAVESCCRKR